jgi:hypothetical protein
VLQNNSEDIFIEFVTIFDFFGYMNSGCRAVGGIRANRSAFCLDSRQIQRFGKEERKRQTVPTFKL